MLTPEIVRNVLMDELRSHGYAPNPADVAGAVAKIMDLASVEEKAAAPEPAAPAPVVAPTTPVVTK